MAALLIAGNLLFLQSKVTAQESRDKTKSIAPTPPMGWNSWNKFAEKVDDKTVREMADTIVSTGMKDAVVLAELIASDRPASELLARFMARRFDRCAN